MSETGSEPERREAKADPTKGFFVRMLTRDISLDDCILDLVDNSIDGAWQQTGATPTLVQSDALADYRVDLIVAADRFSIADNCGGIALDEAMDYAFSFGKLDDDAATYAAGDDPVDDAANDSASADEVFSVGVYGIGMKRAVFKLGQSITVESTFKDLEGRTSAFEVPIEVRSWLADETVPWRFPILPASPAAEPGVTITVKDLARATAARFGNPAYEAGLRRTLGRDYLLPLMQGLTVTLNEQPVAGTDLGFKEGEGFAPMRTSYQDGDVTVEILAGMAEPPPDDLEPDESDRRIQDWGWYLICNGRVVLGPDATNLTGWGVNNLPGFHPQYAGFRGMVLFTSPNPGALPMTTTKRGIDVSSEVYIRARSAMAAPARSWIDYTNARKADREAAKAREAAASPVRLADVAEAPAVSLPTSAKGTKVRLANVNYAKPVPEMNRLAKALGNINKSYRDVGIESFDYAYRHLVDEDGS